MQQTGLPTSYAPPERVTSEVIERQAKAFRSLELLPSVLDALPYPTVVVNTERQVVFCNCHVFDLTGLDNESRIIGRRPGEIVGCVHAAETHYGCGTSEACRTCGAVNAILSGQHDLLDNRETRIRRRHNGKEESLDLLVSAAPLHVVGERFTLVSLIDISNEKRRQALERTFFHDILNIVCGLQGLSYVLLETAPEGELNETAKMISSNIHHLIAEITSQRQLLAAETNELAVNPVKLDSLELIERLINQYRGYPIAKNRTIAIDKSSCRESFISDGSLLGRVIGNMIKNALEATEPGGVVTIGCISEEDTMEFWIRNSAFIPRETQLQIFQRSFSTKGTGRGLGTYSMKLILERYLSGFVGFSSSEEEGTRFYVRIPRTLS